MTSFEKYLVLLAVLLFSNMFLFFRNDVDLIHPFLFSDMSLTAENYFYFLFEKLIVIMLAGVIMASNDRNEWPLLVFFMICCIDLLDYLLFYANPWFAKIPFTWNQIKVVVFLIIIGFQKLIDATNR